MVRTRVGYAGGTKKNPTYMDLGDHSETVASTSPIRGPGDEFIVPLDDMSYPSSRAMRRREVVQIPDAFVADWVSPRFKQRAEQRGRRT